jgi:hypothetical protein
VRKLEAYGDAYEHAKPGLLGNQCAEGASALLLVLLTRDATYLGVVRVSEPAAFAERFGEDPLEGGCRVHDDVLCVDEASRFDQRLERRVNFGSRIGAVGQSRSIIGRWEPCGDYRRQMRMLNAPQIAHPLVATSVRHSPTAWVAPIQTVLARLKPKPSVRPSSAPVTPASQLTSGRAYGIASSTAAIAAVASRSPS